MQRLFCSFDGTTFLIRAVGSPVQVYYRGRISFILSLVDVIFPAGPLQFVLAPRPPEGCVANLELLNGGEIVMKNQRPASANQTPKLSDALADRYLDLQRLRDEVRKAEATDPRRTKKLRHRKQLHYLTMLEETQTLQCVRGTRRSSIFIRTSI
jgi:hypothetical protein